MPEKGGTAASVKWIVLGVVLLAFMVLFRSELGDLLGRAEEVSVSATGVTFKTRTVTTPIGETVLAQAPQVSAPTGAPVASAASFTDPQRRFQIDWPDDGSWNRNQAAENQFGANLFVMYHQQYDDFTPNVNITTEDIGAVGVDQWLEIGNGFFTNMGYEIVSSEVDQAAGTVVRVVLNRNWPGGLYQVQRAILKNGSAYVVTGSKLQTGGAPAAVDRQMADILNSFRVL